MPSYQPFENDSLDLDPSSPFFLDHVARYWWAASRLKGKRILDCACGKGYGSYIVARQAREVVGVDLNPESLKTAQQVFQRAGLEFRSCDGLLLSRLGKEFDAVIAFEVIEHLAPEDTDRFLASVSSVLIPGGEFFISTPNHDVVRKSGSRVPEFHINNFHPEQLRRVLREHFPHVEMLGQFQARKGLSRYVFDVDRLNLRHVWGKRALRWLSFENNAPNGTSSPQPSIRQEWFDSPYPGVEKYRFSSWHWRQAGLTVAVCRKNEVRMTGSV